MLKLSKYCITSEYDDKLLLYSTLSLAFFTLPLKLRDSINPFDEKSFTSKEIDFLLKKKFIYKNEEIDIIAEFKENQSKILSDVYEIQITPSASCQLGCDYCGQEHYNKKLEKNLDIDLLKHIENKIKLTKCSLLIVQWYGGEPLTALTTVERLSKKIISLCSTYNISYKANMVTNGVVLSKSTFQRLLDVNIFEFQITLDGEEKEHNKRRFFKNGNGSFNKIYNNIKNICNTEYKEKYLFNIRVNIDKRNENSLWLLMDKLEQDGLNNKISLYIKPVHNWENDASLLCLSTEEFAKYEIDFYSRKILNNYKNASALFPPRLFTTCMATSNGTMELVDIKGNLFNCNEMPFIERLEKFALGNVSNSKVIPDLYELDKWYDKVEDNTHSNCSNCALLPVCGGYCPKHWIDGNKDVCPSIKHNIKELLQLKYLLTQNV